ncbi:DUF3558 family protein [Prauserella rugosa]|uniref:DUF3558 family protein n=1 Tax=Prauserella rugosa TaxID=43354 RepID=UPI000A005E1B
MTRKLGTLALGALAVLATACSSEEGQAEPRDPASEAPSSAAASSEAASDLPHSGAPAVENPLPESALSGDPCDALTRKQITDALGEGASPDGERRDLEQLGPRCRWTNIGSGASFVVTFQTAHGEGLSTTYANAKPQMPVFNEVDPIEGFPAVAYKESESDPMCTTMVGISNEQAVSVTGTISSESEQEGTDSCGPVQQITSWVVSNIKTQS